MKMYENSEPDYRRIYGDIITQKHSEKKEICQNILEKRDLSVLDIIKLNTLLFETENRETEVFSHQHRPYNESAILEILEYQKKNSLNNSQTASHFKMSRNTLAKWQKMFNLCKP